MNNILDKWNELKVIIESIELDVQKNAETLEDKDLDYARKLQASFGKKKFRFLLYLAAI